MHGLGIADQRPGQGAPLGTVRAEIRAVWSGSTTHAHAAVSGRSWPMSELWRALGERNQQGTSRVSRVCETLFLFERGPRCDA